MGWEGEIQGEGDGKGGMELGGGKGVVKVMVPVGNGKYEVKGAGSISTVGQ